MHTYSKLHKQLWHWKNTAYGNSFLYSNSLALPHSCPHNLTSSVFFNSNIISMYSWLNEETTECKIVIVFWLHKPRSSKTALKLFVVEKPACFCRRNKNSLSLYKNGHPIDIIKITQGLSAVFPFWLLNHLFT